MNINLQLIEACRNNKPNHVEILLDKGADIKYNKYEAVRVAVTMNNIKIVKIFFDREKSILIKNNFLMNDAVFNNNFEMVKFLLDMEVVIEESIFHRIIQKNNIEMLKLLICSKKIDVSMHHRILIIASRMKKYEIIDIVLSCENVHHIDCDILMKNAIYKNDTKMIKLLLKKGVNFHICDSMSIEIKNIINEYLEKEAIRIQKLKIKLILWRNASKKYRESII